MEYAKIREKMFSTTDILGAAHFLASKDESVTTDPVNINKRHRQLEEDFILQDMDLRKKKKLDWQFKQQDEHTMLGILNTYQDKKNKEAKAR